MAAKPGVAPHPRAQRRDALDGAFHEQSLRLDSPNGILDARIAYPADAGADAAVIIAPPHPRYGGDLRNNVVKGMSAFLAGCGYPVLTFNYHGVGESRLGAADDVQRALYWHHISETDARERGYRDLLAAREWLEPIVSRVHVAGYSLGAIVALRLAAEGLAASATAVALPIDEHPMPFLRAVAVPVLAVLAEGDFASHPEAVRRELTVVRGPVRLELLSGTDHFFRGRELEVAALAADFIGDWSRDSTSVPGGGPARRA
jgi:hypothetical protein